MTTEDKLQSKLKLVTREDNYKLLNYIQYYKLSPIATL